MTDNMDNEEKSLSEKESLDLIAKMINKAKDGCHDTGISAIMWGALIAFCSLVRLSEMQFGYKLPFDIYILTVAALIPQIIFQARENKKRKVKTYDDVFMNAVWTGFGISIFLLIFIMNVMYNQWAPGNEEYLKNTGKASGFNLFEFNAPLFLLLYGMPTFVTGLSIKFRPMLLGGIFCWICCMISCFTTIKIDLILLALSSVFAWLIPGIIMEKDYRKAKRELAKGNV